MAEATARDLIRKDILGKGRQFKRKIVKFFDSDIEFRQPTLASMTAFTTGRDPDRNAVALMLIEYAYVPGTEEKVFTKEDYDAIMSLPTGPWVSTIQDAWLEVSQINVEEAEKNSGETG